MTANYYDRVDLESEEIVELVTSLTDGEYLGDELRILRTSPDGGLRILASYTDGKLDEVVGAIGRTEAGRLSIDGDLPALYELLSTTDTNGWVVESRFLPLSSDLVFEVFSTGEES